MILNTLYRVKEQAFSTGRPVTPDRQHRHASECGVKCATHIFFFEKYLDLMGVKSLFWVDENLLQIDGYTYPDISDNCDESVRRYWRRELNPNELLAKDEQIERNDYEEVSWVGSECDSVFRKVGENKIAIVRNGVETMTSENRVVLEFRRPKECS